MTIPYALIRNGVVENVVLADAAYVATLTGYDAVIANPAAGVGWLYDGQAFTAPEPVEPPPPAPAVIPALTQLQFRLLLTQAERLKCRELRQQDLVLDDFLGLLDIAQEVELSNPLTIYGLSYASSIGCFTPERLAQILAAQPAL